MRASVRACVVDVHGVCEVRACVLVGGRVGVRGRDDVCHSLSSYPSLHKASLSKSRQFLLFLQRLLQKENFATLVIKNNFFQKRKMFKK